MILLLKNLWTLIVNSKKYKLIFVVTLNNTVISISRVIYVYHSVTGSGLVGKINKNLYRQTIYSLSMRVLAVSMIIL